MLAWISGEAGRYAIPSGVLQRIACLGSSATFLVSEADVQRSFVGVFDVEKIRVDDESQARLIASSKYETSLAIRLFFLLYDEQESHEERKEVATDLNELLLNKEILRAVENLLYSHKYPTLVENEYVSLAVSGLSEIDNFVRKLSSLQPAIEKVRASFDQVEKSAFDPKVPYFVFNELAINKGCFRTFVLSQAAESPNNFALLTVLSSLQGIPGARQVTTLWAAGFSNYVHRSKELELEPEAIADDTLVLGPAGRKIFENVRRQQKAIIEKLHEGNFGAARRYASELVEAQRRTSDDSEYVARSLCLLSQEAKQLELWEIQHEWARWATQLRPTDPITHGQEADALINLGRMIEAAASLDRAAETGDRLYAATSRARILRETGKLKEARDAYLAAYQLHASEADAFHALGGAAGTAREMGMFDIALEEYDRALALYPSEAILLSGRAATLGEMGRWQEVISTLDILQKKNPRDREALLGKAHALKISGRLELAVEDFSAIVVRFPFDPRARFGLIDSLRLLERYEEALQIFEDARERFPNNAKIISLGADIKREIGKPQEAVTDLEQAIVGNPNDLRIVGALVRSYRACFKNEEALTLIDKAISQNPYIFWLRVERADLLKRLGYVDLSLYAYDQLLQERPNYLSALNAKAALLAHLGRFNEANSSLPTVENAITQSEWQSFILRGVIYSRQGRPADALIHLNILPKAIPFVRERRMFLNAVAAAELAFGRVNAAAAVAADAPGEISNVIHFHALAAARSPRAASAYDTNEGLSSILIDLKEEIARRYGIVRAPARFTLNWILEAEQNALLLEAA